MFSTSLEDLNGQIQQMEVQLAQLQAEAEKQRKDAIGSEVQQLIQKIASYAKQAIEQRKGSQEFQGHQLEWMGTRASPSMLRRPLPAVGEDRAAGRRLEGSRPQGSGWMASGVSTTQT